MNMKPWVLAVSGALCSCAGPQLPNNQTADARFAALHGGGERQIAHDFYQLGEGDSIKRLYWAQRRAQESGDAPVHQVSLQRRYVNIPVPEHVEPDGTLKEASTNAVEIVQFWTVTKSHGRNLFLTR